MAKAVDYHNRLSTREICFHRTSKFGKLSIVLPIQSVVPNPLYLLQNPGYSSFCIMPSLIARNIHSCVALGNLNYVCTAILRRKYLRKSILNKDVKS